MSLEFDFIVLIYSMLKIKLCLTLNSLMKVILVTSYLASKGGVARVVWEFAEYLATQGDDVLVASLFLDKTIYSSKNKIKIIDLADRQTLPQSMKFWLSLRKIKKRFADLVKQEKPDIIIFHDFPATLWVQKYDPSIPVLCYTHDIHMLYTDTYINNLPFITKSLWKIIRLFVRSYDRQKWINFDDILCNSNFLSRHILRTYKRNSKVIYPGTNTSIFSSNNPNMKENVILSLADIKLRRADFLIEAANQLKKKRNDFKIWIVGNKSEYEKELTDIVERYELNDTVKFFGKVSDSLLAELYSKSLVVVHLVKEAPFGLIVTEAMACGSPVISWKPGGPEEIIIHGESGFLIEENNLDDLTNHLEQFLDNPQMSIDMGKNARNRIVESFEMLKQDNELRELMIEWKDKKEKSTQRK